LNQFETCSPLQWDPYWLFSSPGSTGSSNIVFQPSVAEGGDGGTAYSYGSIRKHDCQAHAHNPRSLPITEGQQIRIVRRVASSFSEDLAGHPNRHIPWNISPREHQTRILGLDRSRGSLFDD
jgi:hypothetical protein